MPRCFKQMIICVLLLIIAVPVSAELYQYRDKNGIMRLTDNIYSVPLEYRSQLEEYSEIEGISDEMEIQPLLKKPLTQVVQPPPQKVPDAKKTVAPETDQGRAAEVEEKITPTAAEKTITPKTEKSISAEAEKKIIAPATVPETAQEALPVMSKDKEVTEPDKKTAAPSRPTIPEKSVPEPASHEAGPKPYLSKKITIDRSIAPPEEKVTDAPAEKPTRPEAEALPVVPEAPQTQKETPAVSTRQKKADLKAGQAQPRQPVPQKTTTDSPEKPTASIKTPATEKDSSPPKTATPEIEKKSVIATQQSLPEKTGTTAENKSIQKTITSTVKEKESKPESIIPVVEPQQLEKPVEVRKAETKKDPIKSEAQGLTAAKKQPEPIVTAQTEAKKATSKPSAEVAVPQTETKQNVQYKSEKDIRPHDKAVDETPEALTVPAVTSLKDKETTSNVKGDIRKTTGKESASTSADEVVYQTSTFKKEGAMITAAKPVPDKYAVEQTPRTASRETPSLPPELTADLNLTPDSDETNVQKATIDITAEEFAQKDERLQLAYLQTTRKSLAERKEALNKRYMELMKEKESLENNVDEDDEASVLEYNKNVKKLNIKIKQYKKEKKLLQAEIEKYNNLIRQSTSN